MRQKDPASVEVTLPDGKVMHFAGVFGDKIVLNKVETYKKEIPPKQVAYYTLMITPAEGRFEGDD